MANDTIVDNAQQQELASQTEAQANAQLPQSVETGTCHNPNQQSGSSESQVTRALEEQEHEKQAAPTAATVTVHKQGPIKVLYNACFGGRGYSEEANEWIEMTCEQRDLDEASDDLYIEMVETLGMEKASDGFAEMMIAHFWCPNNIPVSLFRKCIDMIIWDGKEKLMFQHDRLIRLCIQHRVVDTREQIDQLIHQVWSMDIKSPTEHTGDTKPKYINRPVHTYCY